MFNLPQCQVVGIRSCVAPLLVVNRLEGGNILAYIVSLHHTQGRTNPVVKLYTTQYHGFHQCFITKPEQQLI